MKLFLVLGFFSIILTGCGSKMPASQPCVPIGFAMLVRSKDPLAAPDHNQMPPANQELFVAGVGSLVGPGCVSNNLYTDAYAQWMTSDTKNVSISSAADTSNGLATCIGMTASGAFVSATLTSEGFTQTLSAPLVCK